MSSGDVTFSSESFSNSFPFGFVASESGAFRVIGAALQRIGATAGSPVDETLEVVRPWSINSVLELPRNPGAAVLLWSTVDSRSSTCKRVEMTHKPGLARARSLSRACKPWSFKRPCSSPGGYCKGSRPSRIMSQGAL